MLRGQQRAARPCSACLQRTLPTYGHTEQQPGRTRGHEGDYLVQHSRDSARCGIEFLDRCQSVSNTRTLERTLPLGIPSTNMPSRLHLQLAMSHLSLHIPSLYLRLPSSTHPSPRSTRIHHQSYSLVRYGAIVHLPWRRHLPSSLHNTLPQFHRTLSSRVSGPSSVIGMQTPDNISTRAPLAQENVQDVLDGE